MSKPISDERAAFEAWARTEGRSVEPDHAGYADVTTHWASLGWQAALAHKSEGSSFEDYRRGVMEAFHNANMINVNRQGRTAEETCAYLVRSLAELANGGAPAAPVAAPVDASQTSPALPATGMAAPIPEDIRRDLERGDWTPEEALRWYAAGKHFDVVNLRTRIIDTGAIASNALKHSSPEYHAMKGADASFPSPPLRAATLDARMVDLPSRVIDMLYQSAGVSTYHPDGDQQDKLHEFARNVVAETLARLPSGAAPAPHSGEAAPVDSFPQRLLRESDASLAERVDSWHKRNAALLPRASDAPIGEAGGVVAHVPIHPTQGPLWANTVPSLDSGDRPKHYPTRPLCFAAQPQAAPSGNIPDGQRLSYELQGVIVDVEQGDGFDSVCLDTIKRVCSELARMKSQNAQAAPSGLSDARVDYVIKHRDSGWYQVYDDSGLLDWTKNINAAMGFTSKKMATIFSSAAREITEVLPRVIAAARATGSGA